MGVAVALLDHGSGNLHSARRALQRAGAEVTLTADPALATGADGLVVPGVGAFAASRAGLDAIGAGPMIAARVATGAPVLGICVGMQVLFDLGVEHGVATPGLGLLPGRVELLDGAPGVRVPHMGWNTVTAPAGSRLFAGIDAGTRFYFVHSYAVRPSEQLRAAGAQVAITEHGAPLVAAVELGALCATQFHPEKSGAAGAALLHNWLAIVAGSARHRRRVAA